MSGGFLEAVHVIMDMCSEIDNPVDLMALFSGIHGLTTQDFPKWKEDDPAEDKGLPWPSLVKQVYVLQFLNCDSENAAPGDTTSWFWSLDAHLLEPVRVTIFQIEWPRIHPNVPLAMDSRSLQDDFAWWVYGLRLSGQLTKTELDRWRDLKLPPEIESGLQCLRRCFWSVENKTQYAKELGRIAAASPVSEVRQSMGGHAAPSWMVLTELCNRFVDSGNLNGVVRFSLEHRFTVAFVQEFWKTTTHPENVCEGFIDALKHEKMIRE
jgi:hypothetical protein